MKNILLEYSPIIRLLMSYQWLLRALANCESQYKIISRHIDEGSAAEDVVDPDWKNKISAEAKNIRDKLRLAQQIVADIPDSPELLQCKLFLRNHYILGMSLTNTAADMDVSNSTIRRVKDRSFHYLSVLDAPELIRNI